MTEDDLSIYRNAGIKWAPKTEFELNVIQQEQLEAGKLAKRALLVSRRTLLNQGEIKYYDSDLTGLPEDQKRFVRHHVDVLTTQWQDPKQLEAVFAKIKIKKSQLDLGYQSIPGGFNQKSDSRGLTLFEDIIDQFGIKARRTIGDPTIGLGQSGIPTSDQNTKGYVDDLTGIKYWEALVEPELRQQYINALAETPKKGIERTFQLDNLAYPTAHLAYLGYKSIIGDYLKSDYYNRYG